MIGLEIKNLVKSFGNVEVLKGIDLTVNKGDICAIIGSSGSGKTTLLRCLNYLEEIDSGEILIDGKSVIKKDSANATKKALSAEEARQLQLKTGLVFQSFNLFPHMTVLDNLLLAPLSNANETLKGCSKAEKTAKKKELKAFYEQKALSLLEQVGLSHRVNNYPCTLSGGEKQRAAIARALMLEPLVLSFDEPTSALDPLLTIEVLKVIKNLKSSDRTMVLVTHEMEFAKNVADKVVYMYNGYILEAGTPDEIFNHPKTEELRSFLSKSAEVVA